MRSSGKILLFRWAYFIKERLVRQDWVLNVYFILKETKQTYKLQIVQNSQVTQNETGHELKHDNNV